MVGLIHLLLLYVMLMPSCGIRLMAISAASPSMLNSHGPDKSGGCIYGGAMGGSAIGESTDGTAEVGAYPPPVIGIVADRTNGSTVLVKVTVSTTLTGGGCDRWESNIL